MYEYLDRKPEVGDIVETKYTKAGTDEHIIHIVRNVTGTTVHYTSGGHDSMTEVRVIKVRPGSEAKLGDSIIRIPSTSGYSYYNEHTIGKMETVNTIIGSTVDTGGMHIHFKDFLVLCKAEPSTLNQFQKGDMVRYIGDPSSERPSECTVYAVDGDDVYYRNGFACHYKHWELISRAKVEPESFCKENVKEEVPEMINNKLNIKEETMPPKALNSDELAYTIAKYIEDKLEPKVKSDYENRKKFTGVIYSHTGKYLTTVYANKEKQLHKIMQTPEYLGMTMVVHKATTEVTTDIPLKVKDI